MNPLPLKTVLSAPKLLKLQKLQKECKKGIFSNSFKCSKISFTSTLIGKINKLTHWKRNEKNKTSWNTHLLLHGMQREYFHIRKHWKCEFQIKRVILVQLLWIIFERVRFLFTGIIRWKYFLGKIRRMHLNFFVTEFILFLK